MLINFILLNTGLKVHGVTIMFGLAAGLFIFSGLKSKKRIFKPIFYNLSAIFIALFVFELYGFYREPIGHGEDRKKSRGTFFKNKNFASKKDVGYGPKDSTFSVWVMECNHDTLVYHAVYSIENGLRKTSRYNTSSHKYALFLGCSYTFGFGLNDDETLPSYFNEFTDSSFHVVNYAYIGYGTHHALKITQEKIAKEKTILSSDSSIAIYSFIPHHILRSAGKVYWDLQGPWYEIENDSITYKGTFENRSLLGSNRLVTIAKEVWRFSYLHRKFFAPVKKQDVLRTVKMIEQMNIEFKRHSISFYVVLGSEQVKTPEIDFFYSEFYKTGIPYFLIDSIIPDIKSNHDAYFIVGDGHPNPNYNRKLAEFLAKKIAPK